MSVSMRTLPREDAPASREAPRRRGARKAAQIPLWWAVPGLAFVIAFVYATFVAGAWYAFTDWNGVSAAAKWIGLSNFREIIDSADSRAALWHTLELTAAFVVVVNTIGLALALGLHRTVRSRNILRAAFFAPIVLSPLAVSFIWQFIFDTSGPLNGLLGAVGLDSWKKTWTGDPRWALWTVFVVMVWQFAGLAMTLFLAGLQGIPEEIDEAALVDGASTWFRLRRVTLPLLAAPFTISTTLMSITGLRVFDQVKGLTGGGPAGASETLATQVYAQGFVNGRFGYSAAFGVILTLLVAIVSLTQVLVLRRREARL
jgi:raffinose/stachyose/melibiose transport system permease protein